MLMTTTLVFPVCPASRLVEVGFLGSCLLGANVLSLCPTSRSKDARRPAGKVSFFHRLGGSAVGNQRAARTVTLDKINMHYTEDYDNDFDSIAFYRNYPQYRPFVGKHFAGGKSKILLLAESHYLPIGSTAHLLPKNWYENSSAHLTDKERIWINTRELSILVKISIGSIKGTQSTGILKKH